MTQINGPYNDKKRQTGGGNNSVPAARQTGGTASPAAPSSYNADSELDSLYSAISSRRRFSYDPSSDPMYRSYAQRYAVNGRMAMRDSMGQAAALTGGYGSSYSAAVGQQQYDEYLRALSETLPELYQLAYQRYEDEGDALRDRYDIAYQRRETDYRREQDAQAELQRQEQQEYSRRQDSYKSLTKLISEAGYSPTDEELVQAGMTRAQAQALLNRYLMDNGLLGSAGAASGGSSGGSSKKKEKKTAVTPTAAAVGIAGGVKAALK